MGASEYLTRAEQRAVDEVHLAYNALSIDAKGEFHKAIGVYAAHPLAVFIAGALFVVVIWWL